MAQDILVIVNCETNAVQMYCDPSILYNSSEGSSELWVKVPVSTNLRWRTVPLQLTDEGAGIYHTIISAYRLWPGASDYLVDWATSNGGGDAPRYNPPGELNQEVSAPIAIEGINRPFIQCLTQLKNRDEMQSPQVAYTFYIDIYKNGHKLRTINWDPYVTVYRPQ